MVDNPDFSLGSFLTDDERKQPQRISDFDLMLEAGTESPNFDSGFYRTREDNPDEQEQDL